jgi:hypothetical protein
MLLPGYVLTLDMVFGPQTALFVIPSWIIQKGLLFGIFFLLFYIPLSFYPFINKHEEAYVTSLLFAVNPFVYERFLAGQWLVLLAYALLPALVYYLVQFHQFPSRKNLAGIFVSLFFIGAVSPHFLVMTSLTLFIYALFFYKHLKRLFFGGLVFLTVSLPWIVPGLVDNNKMADYFSHGHWEAFQTASDPKLGVVGNVLTLHGFWGEREWWVSQFTMPKDNQFWIVIISAIWLLAGIGIVSGLADRKLRRVMAFLFIIGLMSIIFSSGVSGNFRPINIWLFENISFWKGFRDTEKWSGLLVLVYALCAGLGAGAILGRMKDKFRNIVIIALCALPIFYTPQMLFGFSGQLKAVWYPASWAAADEILEQDPECQALFLPWHQYYVLGFNNRILTGNPSKSFFSCEIISGENMELAGIDTQEGHPPEYYELEALVTSNVMDVDQVNRVIEYLKSRHFRYIILSHDLIDQDEFTYPFLSSSRLQKIIHSEVLYLFKIL